MARSSNAHDSDDASLLSYGSPRRSFSGAANASAVKGDATAAGDSGNSGDPQTLLAFYRQRSEQFQQERQTMLDHLANVEVSKEEFHRLKWELRTKHEEVSELEDALKTANATLFSVKSELIDAQAANAKLRVQEAQDRQKIQHLLALTQPIIEEVSFFRDCRPGTTASYPVAPTRQPVAYPSTMHIASEMGMQQRRRSTPANHVHHDSGRRSSRESARVLLRSVSSASTQASKVLRTVYLPNEQAAMLSKTVESLEAQLVAHQQLTDERIQTLLDEFATEKAKLTQHASALDDRAQALERQLDKSQRLLHQTTKDYLVLRHQSQETERLAHEEVHTLERKCATLASEREHVLQQAVAETQALKRSVQEEGHVFADEFWSQAMARERDLHILKEQYAAVQDACTHRIQDLQARLTKLRGRYRSLEKRRAMELEGFTRDISALKRHLQKLEVMHYGRRLTAQERQSMRLDEHNILDANELSEEVAALRHRVQELAHELSLSPESGDRSMLELGAPTFAGKGCADADTVSVALSTNGAQLHVAFPTTFAAQGAAGSAKHTRVACNGVIPITIPKGFSVGITRDVLEGDVEIPPDAAKSHYAQATSEVFFAAQRRGPKTKQRFDTLGALRFRSTTPTDASGTTTWSVCGGTATLRINTAVTAHGPGVSIHSAGLRYTVAYKPCSSGESDSDADDAPATQSSCVRRTKRSASA